MDSGDPNPFVFEFLNLSLRAANLAAKQSKFMGGLKPENSPLDKFVI